jgi:PPK2 family polyphosphate:nucleotide phosphotransferase
VSLARFINYSEYLVAPGKRVHLGRWNPGDTSGVEGKEEGERELDKLKAKLESLQEMLYAEHKHMVLVVLQGIDTSGKDGTIRRVFEGVNPEGVRVAKFGPPTPEELDHGFLWRVHKETPRRGEIVIFNRSHYEGVLVERVHKLVPTDVWGARYRQINGFERMLVEEGATVLKFYLHIDKEEQTRRLLQRLDDPTKHWKFSLNDVPERRFWHAYMQAYSEALQKTSSSWAPWYVVPSNHAWFRDLVVCRVMVDALKGLKMRYPGLPKSRKALRAELSHR